LVVLKIADNGVIAHIITPFVVAEHTAEVFNTFSRRFCE